MQSGLHRQRQAADLRHRRSQLMPGSAHGSTSPRKSDTASEAAEIQNSLSRTQALLQHELERVSHVASVIQHDGQLLDETTSLHKKFNVKGAKRALTDLERAQQREQRILMLSVAFFWITVAYIAWERILTRLPFVDRILQLLPSFLS